MFPNLFCKFFQTPFNPEISGVAFQTCITYSNFANLTQNKEFNAINFLTALNSIPFRAHCFTLLQFFGRTNRESQMRTKTQTGPGTAPSPASPGGIGFSQSMKDLTRPKPGFSPERMKAQHKSGSPVFAGLSSVQKAGSFTSKSFIFMPKPFSAILKKNRFNFPFLSDRLTLVNLMYLSIFIYVFMVSFCVRFN